VAKFDAVIAGTHPHLGRIAPSGQGRFAGSSRPHRPQTAGFAPAIRIGRTPGTIGTSRPADSASGPRRRRKLIVFVKNASSRSARVAPSQRTADSPQACWTLRMALGIPATVMLNCPRALRLHQIAVGELILRSGRNVESPEGISRSATLFLTPFRTPHTDNADSFAASSHAGQMALRPETRSPADDSGPA